MVDKDKQDPTSGIEEIKVPEKRSSSPKQVEHFDWHKDEIREKKENIDDKIVSAELRQEIEKMEMDDKTKSEAEKKAKKIEFLGEKEKIEHLLQTARKKGLVFTIQVAKNMNDPYLLDILHDILSQEGYYQKFVK